MKKIFLPILILLVLTVACSEKDLSNEINIGKKIQLTFNDDFENSYLLTEDQFTINWDSPKEIYFKENSSYYLKVIPQVSFKTQSNLYEPNYEMYLLSDSIQKDLSFVKAVKYKGFPEGFNFQVNDFSGILSFYRLNGELIKNEVYHFGKLQVVDNVEFPDTSNRAPTYSCNDMYQVKVHHFSDWFSRVETPNGVSSWKFVRTDFEGITYENYWPAPGACGGEDYHPPAASRYLNRVNNGGFPPPAIYSWGLSQTVGKLCDDILFTKKQDAYYAQVDGIGLTAINHQSNKVLDATFATVCISIPVYGINRYQASTIFVNAVNTARSEIEVLLNSGVLLPTSYEVRIKLRQLILSNLKFFNINSSFSTQACSGSIPSTIAGYGC